MAAGRGGSKDGGGWALVRACPTCGRHGAACRCRGAPAKASASKPTLRLRLEKRSGRNVTVLAATDVAERALRGLLAELKASLATGGTLKGGEMELQGDHRDRLRPLLAGRGLVVKG